MEQKGGSIGFDSKRLANFASCHLSGASFFCFVSLVFYPSEGEASPSVYASIINDQYSSFSWFPNRSNSSNMLSYPWARHPYKQGPSIQVGPNPWAHAFLELFSRSLAPSSSPSCISPLRRPKLKTVRPTISAHPCMASDL